MQTTVLLLVKVGLLVLLWFFIGMTIRCLKKETDYVSGVSSSAHRQDHTNSADRSALKQSRKFLGTKTPHSLTVVAGRLTGTTLSFAGYTEIIIGRAPQCTLVLDDDFSSGTHARLVKRGSDWYVEDLDSRNGTWLGNQRIDQPELLSTGMRIRIGQTHLRMDA